MKLREYLKEMIGKVDSQEDEGGMLAIFVSENLDFKYHDECFADFHEDFCILYDKVTETSMVVPYDKISAMQYMTDEIIRKQAEELDIKKMLKKLMED